MKKSCETCRYFVRHDCLLHTASSGNESVYHDCINKDFAWWGCAHKFNDGKCTICEKSLSEIFVEETSKEENNGC